MDRFQETKLRVAQYAEMNKELYALSGSSDSLGNARVIQLIADLFAATSLDQRWQLMKKCLADFGADQVNYGLFETFAPDRGKARLGLLSTMDPSWIDFYIDKKIDLLDLHLDLVRQEPVPTYLWGEGGLKTVDKSDNKELYNAIELTFEAGLRSSLHLTLNDPWNPNLPAGMMAIGSCRSEDDYFRSIMPHQQAITTAAQVFHTLAAGDMRSRELGFSKLTKREKECLQCVAEGLRLDAVATKLNRSRATIEMHLRNARRKLGAKTLPEAVAKALVVQELRLS